MCAYVRRKRPKNQIRDELLLPGEIAGVRVDVLPTGDNITYNLDHTDRVVNDHGEAAITIVNLDKNNRDAWVLTSGHGALWHQKKLHRRYRSKRGEAVRPVEVRSATHLRYNGTLVAGACGGGKTDWAVVRFDDLYEDRIDTHHLLTSAKSPLAYRKKRLAPGEIVYHYSRVQGKRIRGMVLRGPDGPLPGSVALDMGDGTSETYEGVTTVVASGALPFSKPGDSGGLVAVKVGTNSFRAVGMIVGGSADYSKSYVLSLSNLLNDSLGKRYCARFFK